MPRFYCPSPLITGELLDLPAGAARHVQVLRLQPGDNITLFNSETVHADQPRFDPTVTDAADTSGCATAPQRTGEFAATVTHMGRSSVQVQVGAFVATQREALRPVHLLVGMPANERMDWLVEKATELGVASLQPLMTERSVLKLTGERADKKQAHWQSVAIAACEQCGGNRVPQIHPVMTLAHWLKLPVAAPAESPQRLLLSLRDGTLGLREALAQTSRSQTVTSSAITFLSGPEGGLSPAEEAAALQAGFTPVTLGARVLRAETAALAALVVLVV